MKLRFPDLVSVYAAEDCFRFSGESGERGDVSCRLSLNGDGLRLRAMNRGELLVTGRIRAAEWE